MPVVITIIGIGLLILLIAGLRINAFLSFLIVAILVGILSGMDMQSIALAIQRGLGNTLGFLVIILGLGAMIGKMMEVSGAAQKISKSLVERFGQKYLRWALALAGFLIGIPMFFAVAFVVLAPILFVISRRINLSPLYVGLPMIAALSVTHGLLPPHPAPVGLVNEFNADMGTTIFYGILVSVPVIIIAGPVFSILFKNTRIFIDADSYKETNIEKLPGLTESLISAVLPAFLLSLSMLKDIPDEGTLLYGLITIISEPLFAMLLSVIIVAYLLGIRQGMSLKATMDSIAQSVKDIALILLIIAGAGALKEVLTDSGVNNFLASQFSQWDISPYVLAWLVASIIRLGVGSATVAALTTASMVAPLIVNTGVNPNLMVLATGSGSLIFSHVNDGGFWLVKEYLNLSLKDTIRTWSVMETIIAVTGLFTVLLLDKILN